MSSKGQIVVPKQLRNLLGLNEGEIFAIFGDNDTIILKRIEMPSKDEFESLLQWGQKYAKKKGIKRKDVMKAVEDIRS
jgi:antitoxin PrlF